MADSAGGLLYGSVGRQQLVTSQGSVSVSRFFLSPDVNSTDRAMVKDGRLDYAIVDKRIAGVEPLKGFVYEPWEKQIVDYGKSISSATVNRFDGVRDASKEFDSGNIEFFELHRLAP